MGFLTYELKLRTKPTESSSTGAKYGDLGAVIKQDTANAPAQVYCEYVACRLAALVGINVATGVLVPHAKGLMYASLSVSQVGSPLEIVDATNLTNFISRHPVEAARLAVFDLWIANIDRMGNLLASMDNSMDDVVAGIDNGACLLNAESSNQKSLALLKDENQPDYSLLGKKHLKAYCDETIDRIESLSDLMIDDACVLGDTVGSVMLPDQAEISEVLKWRRSDGRLAKLVEKVLEPV